MYGTTGLRTGDGDGDLGVAVLLRLAEILMARVRETDVRTPDAVDVAVLAAMASDLDRRLTAAIDQPRSARSAERLAVVEDVLAVARRAVTGHEAARG